MKLLFLIDAIIALASSCANAGVKGISELPWPLTSAPSASISASRSVLIRDSGVAYWLRPEGKWEPIEAIARTKLGDPSGQSGTTFFLRDYAGRYGRWNPEEGLVTGSDRDGIWRGGTDPIFLGGGEPDSRVVSTYLVGNETIRYPLPEGYERDERVMGEPKVNEAQADGTGVGVVGVHDPESRTDSVRPVLWRRKNAAAEWLALPAGYTNGFPNSMGFSMIVGGVSKRYILGRLFAPTSSEPPDKVLPAIWQNGKAAVIDLPAAKGQRAAAAEFLRAVTPRVFLAQVKFIPPGAEVSERSLWIYSPRGWRPLGEVVGRPDLLFRRLLAYRDGRFVAFAERPRDEQRFVVTGDLRAFVKGF